MKYQNLRHPESADDNEGILPDIYILQFKFLSNVY